MSTIATRKAARKKSGRGKESSSSPASSGKTSPVASAHVMAIAMNVHGVGAAAPGDANAGIAHPAEPPPGHAPAPDGAAPLGGAQEADLAAVPFGEVPVHVAPAHHGEIVVIAPMNLPPGHGQGHGRIGFLSTISKAFLDIIGLILCLLKYPFILFVAVFVSLTLTGYVVDMVTETLTPVCSVFPTFPVCQATAAANALTATFGNLGRKPARDLQRIDFPGLMAVQSRTLDELLAHSAAGSQLALGVKHAELAVKDLGIVVRASNLTSKTVLARSLDEFAQDAKVVGRELQQLSAKLYGAVDKVLAFDDYAVRAITGAQSSGGDIKHTAAQMFRSSMSVLSTEVARVMVGATSVASMLDALEEKLAVIRTVCEQERIMTETALGEVLSELWTLVGGNKVKLLQLGRHVDILRNVDWYRGLSVAHVVATTETLLRVEAELSELRDKLSTPALADDAIPIEVHIASIERSARRLHEGKMRGPSDVAQANHDGSSGQGPAEASIDAP